MDDGRKLQYMVAFAVSLFTTTMGMINSWTLSMLMNFWYNQTNTKIEDVEVNWFYRMIPIGLVVGSVAAGYLCDRFGRRTTILIAVVTSTCASVLSAVATTAWMLFMTHILWTSSWGIMSSAVNIYMAEIVDPDIRGGLIVTTRCMYNFGSLLSIWIKPTSPKLLNGWLIALPILSFAAIYPIPESPYYLLKAGKEDEARKAFMRLQENFGTQEIEPEFQRMRVHAKLELENPNTFIDFLSDNIYRKAVIITFGLELIFLLSGTTAIPDHFLTILSECKINFSPWKMLVLDVVIKIVIGILSALLIDTVGRRILLLSSLIGCSISMAIMGLFFAERDEIGSLKVYGHITFAALIVYLISTSLRHIKDVIQVEVFPLNIRPMAVGTLYTLEGLDYPINNGLANLKIGVFVIYWIYAAVACAGYVFTYYLLPETKGLSLKEIQEMLRGGDGHEHEMTDYDSSNR